MGDEEVVAFLLGDAVLWEECAAAFGGEGDAVPFGEGVEGGVEGEVLDRCAVGAQEGGGFLESGLCSWSGMFPHHRLANRKPSPLYTLEPTLLIIPHVKHIRQQIQICHTARIEPDGIQHQRIQLLPLPRHGVPRRLEPVDAVETSRPDRRAARLRGQGERHLEVRDGGAGARGGAAGGAGWVVGVAGGGADGCRGEFGRGGFAYGDVLGVMGGRGGWERVTEDEGTSLAEDFDG